MLQGLCDFAVPVSLNGIVQVRTFTDHGRSYCLLMEVRNQNDPRFVDHGFGTFLVYSNATRQLSHQAVHPIFDRNTDIQAVTVFKDTDSRSFLMAGAHRNANSAASTCLTDETPPIRDSDPSHNVNSMVQATNEELLAYYGAASWFAIQWHGMRAKDCSETDVHLSHGVDVPPAPTDKICILRDKLLHNSNTSKWLVSVPGSGSCDLKATKKSGSCDLNATKNMQGRLINGVAAEHVCGTPASSITQKFIHIEQHMEFRTPSKWIAPLTHAFP
jgi:hypothetical protein